MTASVPWNSIDGNTDAREAARLAARNAGLSLGDWLDEAFNAKARSLGITADDLTDGEKIEAITQRLADARRDLGNTRDRRRDDAAGTRPRATRFDLLDAAARQVSHDERALAPDVARRISEIEDLLIQRAMPQQARKQEASPEKIDGQLARIAERLRADTPAKPRRAANPVQNEVATLRRQVSELARSVETMASKGIEPALKDLVDKIDRSRAAGIGEDALAPVLRLLVEMRTSLETSPSILARAMRDEIETLSLRLDHLAESGVDTASFTLLRQQVESMAKSLSEMAARMAKQDHLEQQIRTLTQRVEEIAAVPREIAGKLVELVDDMRRSIERLDTSPALRALERRIDQALGQKGEVPPVVDLVLQDVRRSIDTLANHPALVAIQTRMAELANASGQFPHQLIETLTQLRHSIERMSANPALASLEDKLQDMSTRSVPVPANLAESLSEIRLSIERLAANAGLRGAVDHGQRLETIEQRVTQIAEKLETPPFLQKFETLHRDMLERLDKAGSTISDEHAAAILARIGEMQAALASPASNRLEDLIAQLAAKVERVTGSGAPDPRALQAIENQLVRITDRLERNSGSVDAIDTIERSIGDVVSQIAKARQPAADPADTLNTLRSLQDDSERRTQATLNAVHETLEKVVDRLAMLEGDVGSLRRREVEAPAAESIKAVAPEQDIIIQPEPAAPASAVAPPALAPLPQAAPEILIEPGTGFTPPILTRAVEPQAPAVPQPQGGRHELALDIEEPRSAQASFIAAARRATQMMGAPPPPVRNDEDTIVARARARAAAAEAGERNPDGLADTIRKTVYGCTALALILAGWQFANPPKRSRPAQPAIETSAATPDVMPATQARSRTTEELLLELAQNGQATAQHEMAARLLEGRNMPRDVAQALDWFRKSAEQNYAPAQYRLGTMFEKGIGTESDVQAAALWYGRAAEAGHVRAMHNLGVLLADGIDGKPDYAGAARLFRKAAEHGLRDSQYNLAILYTRGLGVDANLVEAYKWFALAGKQGDTDAMGKRDEIGQRLQPRQLGEARVATDNFALLAPDPAANEPASAEALVQSTAAPRNDRMTMLQ